MTDSRQVFLQYIAAHRPEGAVGEVADRLAEGTLDRASFDHVVYLHQVEESRAFRTALLDLILYYVRKALSDHALSDDEIGQLRRLKTIFRIREDDFWMLRRHDIARILETEVHRILADETTDQVEALHQETLQGIFGLGYDQFIELTEGVARPIIERALSDFESSRELPEAARVRLERRLQALGRVYKLSHSQRRTLESR